MRSTAIALFDSPNGQQLLFQPVQKFWHMTGGCDGDGSGCDGASGSEGGSAGSCGGDTVNDEFDGGGAYVDCDGGCGDGGLAVAPALAPTPPAEIPAPPGLPLIMSRAMA